MQTLSRRKTTPGSVYTTKLKRGSVCPQNLPPEWEVSMKLPPIEVEFEEITPNSKGSRNVWKSFEHYKRSSNPDHNATWPYSPYWAGNYYSWPYYGELPAVLLYPISVYGETAFGDIGKFDSDLTPLYLKRDDGGFVPSPPRLDELISAANKQFYPAIKTELSLVNSIIELKDFRSLFKSAFKAYSRTVSSNLYQLSRWWAKEQSLAQITRAMAGNYLQYKFAYAPLVSDICSIYRALKGVERQLNDLLTRRGRNRVMHFARPLYMDTRPVDVKYYGLGTGYANNFAYPFGYLNGIRAERYVYNSTATFHAQIQYNYNYTGYQVEHARLLAYLDAFGINLNPSIVWNALPWSFVLDWVLSVGKYLDQFKTLALEPTVNIQQFLWSVKYERRILITCSTYQDSPNGTITKFQGVPLAVVTETAYKRSVSMPTASSIQSSGLNSNEFTLGAALVVARRRRSS